METNAVGSSAPVVQQTLNIENREPQQTEVNETPPQENREAYRVNISEEALRAQTESTQEPAQSANSVEQGSEAVQAYTSAGQIAG